MNKILAVNFHGTELYGVQLGDMVLVALKPIVEAMGLSWSGQFERVKRSLILREGIRVIRMPFGPGGAQDQVCLSLDLVNGWLFTVDATRVKANIRERVLVYQRECYAVLYRYFSGDRERLIQEEHESTSLNIRLVTEARQIFGNRAAAQLWKKLGLPPVPAMAETFAQGDLFDRLEHHAA